MALTQFSPPGLLDDFTPERRPLWSEWIAERMDESAQGNPADNDGPRTQFFNPLTEPAPNPPGAADAELDIVWTAFPRVIQIGSISDQQRWRRADAARDNQDEYCEWSVERDPQTQKITRVTFTSEGPEYWQVLAEWQPDAVLALYEQHVSPHVQRHELFPGGAYDPRNVWNNSTSRGAMHLIQRSNTLSAEIELAAAATIVRRKNGQIVTTTQQLIECSQYGEPQRHSDPLIGAKVNELARGGARVTLADPVGLYIAGLATAGWAAPDDSDPAAFWRITRGTPQKALRAVYEVPAGRGFVVGDITINGRPIELGAQIADFITIKLTGAARGVGSGAAQPVDGCRGEARRDRTAVVGAGAAAGPRSAAAILRAAGPVRTRR